MNLYILFFVQWKLLWWLDLKKMTEVHAAALAAPLNSQLSSLVPAHAQNSQNLHAREFFYGLWSNWSSKLGKCFSISVFITTKRFMSRNLSNLFDFQSKKFFGLYPEFPFRWTCFLQYNHLQRPSCTTHWFVRISFR